MSNIKYHAAAIHEGGVTTYLGGFDNEHEASQAYVDWDCAHDMVSLRGEVWPVEQSLVKSLEPGKQAAK